MNYSAYCLTFLFDSNDLFDVRDKKKTKTGYKASYINLSKFIVKSLNLTFE